MSFFALGLFVYALRAVGYFSAVPGDFGDDRFNSVILEHVFRWVCGREASLWSPTFFYPFENVLAFSDNHFGSAFFYVLLRFWGFSREIAFDGWFLIGVTLSYFCAFMAFRRIGFAQLASAVGAFVFCFSPPSLRLEIHAQLIYRFAVPLAFAALWDLLATRRLFFLWQVVFWSVVQFLCSIYIGVFLFYLLSATLMAWLFVAQKKNFISELLSGFQSETRVAKFFFCAVTAVSMALLVCLLYRYYAATLQYPLGHPAWQIPRFLPMLSSYFSTDNVMFIGFSVWILFAFGIIKSFQQRIENKIGMIAFISFFLLFAFTLKIEDHSFYLLFSHLPGINAIRAVPRIVLVMLLPIGVLAAVGVEAMQKQTLAFSTTARILLLTVLLGLLGAEAAAFQPRNTPVRQWQERKNSLMALLPERLPHNPLIFVTIKEGEHYWMAELDGMILAQDLGVPTLNGYSGNVPPGYTIASPCSSPLNRLRGYASYRKLPPAVMEPLAQRVVTISPAPCPSKPDDLF